MTHVSTGNFPSFSKIDATVLWQPKTSKLSRGCDIATTVKPNTRVDTAAAEMKQKVLVRGCGQYQLIPHFQCVIVFT